MSLRWLLLVALPLAAQSQPIRVVIDPAPVRPGPAHTVPAELLSHPLSDRGDHAGSVKQLLKTIAKFPDSGAYVYSLLGVEYLKTDQFSHAVDVLQKSVVLLPHDASNHANLGLALLSAGEYDQARPELNRALELDPHYAMASQLLTALARK
jgi:tetratricopeptide (TPR) repeat protein